MNDLFGHAIEPAAFVDIRNQRPSAADEKAELCLRLNSLLRRTPPPRFHSVDSGRPRLFSRAQAGAPGAQRKEHQPPRLGRRDPQFVELLSGGR